MNRHNRFRDFFRFCEDIRNNVCQRSQQLRGHCVSVVNDYADTHDNIILWKKSKSDKKFNLIFSKIACPDTSMNTRTLFENFEGFSQILKE